MESGTVSMDKVLMVDDEPEIVDFFSAAFKNFKHIQFLSALRAVQGMEIAKQEKPKVILLDLRMPGMNGEEALKELKKLLPETKFIIMTAWNDGQTKERILNQIGVSAYFEKPMDFEKVVQKIIELVMVK